MTTELTQITNLVNSNNEKVENICYEEVHRIKISKEDGDSAIVFNTKSILSKLVDYSNGYIQFQFDIKFASSDACTKANLTLKSSYEIISELKIELNDRIISNESKVNYSHIINLLIENSKNDDLIYRNIEIHTDVVKYNDTFKDIFLTKNGDKMRVVCNVFLKDIIVITRFVYVCFFCSLVKLIRSSYFLGILPCNFIQAEYKFIYTSLYTLYTLIQPWYQMQIVEKTVAKM